MRKEFADRLTERRLQPTPELLLTYLGQQLDAANVLDDDKGLRSFGGATKKRRSDKKDKKGRAFAAIPEEDEEDTLGDRLRAALRGPADTDEEDTQEAQEEDESLVEQEEFFKYCYGEEAAEEVFVGKLDATKDPCFICNKPHLLRDCEQFKKWTPIERRAALIKEKRCFRCLKKGHGLKACQSKVKCATCKQPHNTLIHDDKLVQARVQDVEPLENSVASSGNPDVATVHSHAAINQGLSGHNFAFKSDKYRRKSYISLPCVALVIGNPVTGKKTKINALLDSGSTDHFLEETAAEFLGLAGIPVERRIGGVLGQLSIAQGQLVTLEVSSLDGKFKQVVSALSYKDPLGGLAAEDWNLIKQDFTHLQKLPFAEIDDTQDVAMLLGSKNPGIFACACTRSGGWNEPTAMMTPFGWVGLGPTLPNFDSMTQQFSYCYRTRLVELDREGLSQENYNELRKYEDGKRNVKAMVSQKLLDDLTKKTITMWPADPTPEEDDLALTANEQYCLEKLTAERVDLGGRYQMPCLWRQVPPEFPPSREYAIKRMFNNEARFLKPKHGDYHVWDRYNQAIADWEKSGYIEQVPENSGKFYLAHFAVLREDKSTTKVRVVFDGKAKVKGVSLNDWQL